MKKPLVSILIPNYNYARFLKQCLNSAVNQTYDNLEIIVLDNVSTDDSVSVAKEYLRDSRVLLCRNQINIFNKSYITLADNYVRGKYQLLLCSDDYIHPEFVEKAVRIMEEYPNVGYVHGEKDFITENGRKLIWDPFYRCSFVAPGRNVMPIYMMTTVAHPSQGLIRRAAFQKIRGYDKEVDHMNADRTLWFYLSYYYDAAYIKDKMCCIRIGEQTETFIGQVSFHHPILCHLTIKDFVKYAREKNLPEVYVREEAALHKLAGEFLDYAAGMIYRENYDMAKKYLIYAKVVSREIVKDENFSTLWNMAEKEFKNADIIEKHILHYEKKRHGYEPPNGYEEIFV